MLLNKLQTLNSNNFCKLWSRCLAFIEIRSHKNNLSCPKFEKVCYLVRHLNHWLYSCSYCLRISNDSSVGELIMVQFTIFLNVFRIVFESIGKILGKNCPFNVTKLHLHLINELFVIFIILLAKFLCFLLVKWSSLMGCEMSEDMKLEESQQMLSEVVQRKKENKKRKDEVVLSGWFLPRIVSRMVFS